MSKEVKSVDDLNDNARAAVFYMSVISFCVSEKLGGTHAPNVCIEKLEKMDTLTKEEIGAIRSISKKMEDDLNELSKEDVSVLKAATIKLGKDNPDVPENLEDVDPNEMFDVECDDIVGDALFIEIMLADIFPKAGNIQEAVTNAISKDLVTPEESAYLYALAGSDFASLHGREVFPEEKLVIGRIYNKLVKHAGDKRFNELIKNPPENDPFDGRDKKD